jgi:hypothetical protein
MLKMNLDRLFILQQISGPFPYSMEAGSPIYNKHCADQAASHSFLKSWNQIR